MTHSRREDFPPDLQPIAERLRAQRAEASPLELDRIKLKAIARPSQGARERLPGTRGRLVIRSRRVASLAVALGMLGGSTAVLAASGAGPFHNSSNGNGAARSQYCPPTSQAGFGKSKGSPPRSAFGNSGGCGHPKNK